MSFLRRALPGFLLVLAACGPAVEGIDKGVDVIEIRTFSAPVLIQDAAAGAPVARALIEAVKELPAVSPAPDSTLRSGSDPYVRLSLLNDEPAGQRTLLYALLVLRLRDADLPPATHLYYRARNEMDWRGAELDPEAARRVVGRIAEAAGRRLDALFTLNRPRLDAVQRSIEKVSSDEGIFGEEIDLVSVEDVEWPNSALGFPKPGMAYAEMIVPGHRVVLALPGGRNVECHTSGERVETQTND